MDVYRLDFQVDETLVVGIDGAAYHGTPEAAARDAQRDKRLQAKGFRTLRIPAKLVFTSPERAIELLRAARIEGAIHVS